MYSDGKSFNDISNVSDNDHCAIKGAKAGGFRKIRRTFAALSLIVMMAVNGCSGGKGSSLDVNGAGEASSGQGDVAGDKVQGLNGNTYYESKDGVSVTLSTDKLSYEDGEEVDYTLVVSNDTKD
jgi:hypothetical protein